MNKLGTENKARTMGNPKNCLKGRCREAQRPGLLKQGSQDAKLGMNEPTSALNWWDQEAF